MSDSGEIRPGTRVKVLDYKRRYGASELQNQIGTVQGGDQFMSEVLFGYSTLKKVNNLALFSLYEPKKERKEK
jgi:hypothetical protein